MTVAADVNSALIYQAELGESPIWSQRRRTLLWVDTVRQTLNAFDPANGENVARLFPDRVGFVVEHHGGNLFVGVGADVSILSPSGGVTKVTHAFDKTVNHRLNDAKFDSGGRLWVGLMDERLKRGSGLLLCIDTAGAWSIQAGGLTLPRVRTH